MLRTVIKRLTATAIGGIMLFGTSFAEEPVITKDMTPEEIE